MMKKTMFLGEREHFKNVENEDVFLPLDFLTGNIKSDEEMLRMSLNECKEVQICYTKSAKLDFCINYLYKKIPLVNIRWIDEPDNMTFRAIEGWEESCQMETTFNNTRFISTGIGLICNSLLLLILVCLYFFGELAKSDLFLCLVFVILPLFYNIISFWKIGED